MEIARDITTEFAQRVTWSCELCRNTTETPFFLDKKRFCSYKCGFNFIWQIIFGQVFEEFTIKKGWDDAVIQKYCLGLWPKAFQFKKYDRQSWAFELTKFFIGGFTGQ